MKNQKNITDRKQLKSFFKKGSLPDQSAFEKLIDSTFNKADDKLDINEDGLMIYPSDNGKEKLFSFFEDKDDAEARWAMFISKKEDGGLYIRRVAESDFNDQSKKGDETPPPAFFIHKETENIGLGTNSPVQKLDVKGLVSSEGRMGNFLEGEVAADGNWHNVFDAKGLNGCNAFEITAFVQGDQGDGKYALLHAIAVSTYGNSKPKISKTVAHYGKWWNKITLRWESRPSKIEEESGEKKKLPFWEKIAQIWEPKDPAKYNLQIKTKSNYGDDKKIFVKVSVLWDSRFVKSN
jgi:hypothetical protein